LQFTAVNDTVLLLIDRAIGR